MRLKDEELEHLHLVMHTPGHRQRQEALNLLLLRYKPLAMGVVKRQSRYLLPQEDLQQEAMLALLKALQDHPGTPQQAFQVFAWKTIRNRLADANELEKRLKHLVPRRAVGFEEMQALDEDEAMERGYAPDLAAPMVSRELWRLVDRVVPPPTSQVLRLHFQEDLAYEEISRRFGKKHKSWACKQVKAGCVLLRRHL